MKSSRAVLLLLLHTASLEFINEDTNQSITCAYNKEKSACNLCPIYIQDGEIMQDLNLCAGDCQLENHGNSQICVPKAVNCGHRRVSDCHLCPIIQMGSEVTQNISLCQGDCEVKTIRNTDLCLLKQNQSATSTTTAQPTTSQMDPHESSTYPAYPFNSLVPDNSVLVPVLSEITINIVKMNRNTNSYGRPGKIGLKAELCIGSNCCQTSVIYKRDGLYKFSRVFQNLGECSKFTRSNNKEVQIRPVKTSERSSPFHVLRITSQFDDGSFLVAEDVREVGWRRHQQFFLPWGRFKEMMEQEAETSNELPFLHCPEIWHPNKNACPKDNIRVHERLPDERKFCYYQECSTYTADLSSIGIEQLGTGGYCVPKRDPQPQYKYCCDLDQYFTLPDRTQRTEIHFPACTTMNYTRNDI